MLPRHYSVTYRTTKGTRELILAAYNLFEAERQFEYLHKRGFLPGLGSDPTEPDLHFRGIETIEPAPAWRPDGIQTGPRLTSMADAWRKGAAERTDGPSSSDPFEDRGLQTIDPRAELAARDKAEDEAAAAEKAEAAAAGEKIPATPDVAGADDEQS